MYQPRWLTTTQARRPSHGLLETRSAASRRCLWPKMLRINFRAAGYADRGTLYRSQPLEHTPTCMRPVHFGVSLWTALVRNMSMPPGSNELLHILPTQLGTEQQGILSVHPVSLWRGLARFAFAL